MNIIIINNKGYLCWEGDELSKAQSWIKQRKQDYIDEEYIIYMRIS